MTAQDKPYLQAKDPDATPRFREILVTHYGELVGRDHQADTSFYHHQYEQVS